MATDGTKIIDGDTAHDTYWGIMDLFDNDAPTELILEQFPLEVEYDDIDFYDEIYVTSCGLAYWEIGLMTPERLSYITEVISKNACIDEWTQESEKLGRSRKAVLKRYLTKISKDNTKVRKPKKYRKIKNFIFQENDVLSFQLTNDEYRCFICIKINQYRGSCGYWLVPTDYQSIHKPTLADITSSMVLGGTIGTFFSEEELLEHEHQLKIIWEYFDSKNITFGMTVCTFEHKNLLNCACHFETIGQIDFIETVKQAKSYDVITSIADLENDVLDIDKQCTIFNYQKMPIALIMIEKL